MADKASTVTVLAESGCHSGELELAGDVSVRGRFDGVLRAGGTVEVAATGAVTGVIVAAAVRIAGKVDADVVAHEGVALIDAGRLRGRVFARRFMAVRSASTRATLCIGPEAMEHLPAELKDDAPSGVIGARRQARAPGGLTISPRACEARGHADSSLADAPADAVCDAPTPPAAQPTLVPAAMHTLLRRKRRTRSPLQPPPAAPTQDTAAPAPSLRISA